ncbi:MAG: IS200/IS605 family transposase [Candidatus Dadabacteria bacterium]|nr:IS200/IS605 family transposase [Candidatus Dadabacteria bacterium]
MEQLKHSRHCVGGSNYHIQLTPKYRRKVFVGREIRELTKALVRRKAAELGIRVGAIEFGPDHMHVFFTECRKYDVPKIVQHIKGFSSWYIRNKRPELVRPFLWGPSLWSDGYFYESIGRVTSDTVKFYIDRQQHKHWMHEEFDARSAIEGTSKKRQVSLDSFDT